MSLPPAAVPAGREVGVGRVDEERRVTEEQLGLAAAEQRGGVPSIGSAALSIREKKVPTMLVNLGYSARAVVQSDNATEPC